MYIWILYTEDANETEFRKKTLKSTLCTRQFENVTHKENIMFYSPLQNKLHLKLFPLTI